MGFDRAVLIAKDFNRTAVTRHPGRRSRCVIGNADWMDARFDSLNDAHIRGVHLGDGIAVVVDYKESSAVG